MKASLRSVRIAPKKANLIAKMIRGMTVPQALESLERTNKQAARILEDLLKSAMANAQNNDNQDPQELVIKSLIVNQGQAYHRGVPMARGRVRPMRKFLSHITLVLGVASVEQGKSASAQPPHQLRPASKATADKEEKKEKKEKKGKVASQKGEKPVKMTGSVKSTSDSEKGSSSKKKTASTPKVSADQESSPKK